MVSGPGCEEAARALAGEGSTVVLAGGDPDRVGQVLAEIERQGGRAAFFAGDLPEPDQLAALAEFVGEQFARRGADERHGPNVGVPPSPAASSPPEPGSP